MTMLSSEVALSCQKLGLHKSRLKHMCVLRAYGEWVRGSHSLNARRAWRTKSRMPKGQKAGPKGHQLEVGARGAPKFLVRDIFSQNVSQGTLQAAEIFDHRWNIHGKYIVSSARNSLQNYAPVPIFYFHSPIPDICHFFYMGKIFLWVLAASWGDKIGEISPRSCCDNDFNHRIGVFFSKLLKSFQ